LSCFKGARLPRIATTLRSSGSCRILHHFAFIVVSLFIVFHVVILLLPSSSLHPATAFIPFRFHHRNLTLFPPRLSPPSIHPHPFRPLFFTASTRSSSSLLHSSPSVPSIYHVFVLSVAPPLASFSDIIASNGTFARLVYRARHPCHLDPRRVQLPLRLPHYHIAPCLHVLHRPHCTHMLVT